MAGAAPPTARPAADGQVKQLEQIDRPSDCGHPCLHCMGSPLCTFPEDAGYHGLPQRSARPVPGTAGVVLLGVPSENPSALQVPLVHVGTCVDTPARPHSSSMDCVDDALLELVLHALAEASLESIREQQLHQVQLPATPAAGGAQADPGAGPAPGCSDAAHAGAGAAHGAVSAAPELADPGSVTAPGPAAAAATDLPYSIPAAADQPTERPDYAAGAPRAAVTSMPSQQQLEGERGCLRASV